jgi:hypothetical protein
MGVHKGWLGIRAAGDGPDPVSLVFVVDPPIQFQSIPCDTTKLRI